MIIYCVGLKINKVHINLQYLSSKFNFAICSVEEVNKDFKQCNNPPDIMSMEKFLQVLDSIWRKIEGIGF